MAMRDEVVKKAVKWESQHGCGSIGKCVTCMADFAMQHAAGQPQWVDVADGLPVTSGLYWTVLTICEQPVFDSVRFDALTGKWQIEHGKLIEAWMPIQPYQRPSAVEGEKNDE